MAVDIKIKKRRTKAKSSRVLDVISIAIGMRDAYYHYPLLLNTKDLALVAGRFAMASLETLYEGKTGQCDLPNIVANYIAGYKLGSRRCNGMDCKEHKTILASCHKLEAEDEEGAFYVFSLFRTETEIFIKLGHIKDIDDFNSKID